MRSLSQRRSPACQPVVNQRRQIKLRLQGHELFVQRRTGEKDSLRHHAGELFVQLSNRCTKIGGKTQGFGRAHGVDFEIG